MDIINNIICWLRANDVPNWIIGIIWPLSLFYWNMRKVNSVPNLEISLEKAAMTITNPANPQGVTYPTVHFKFKNNTGQIVYIANPRITKASRYFSIPIDASRGIGENSYELNFFNEMNNRYELSQCILQTAEIAITGITVSEQMPDDFFSYNPNWIKQLLRLRKYFKIKFTAMVGDKKYKVSTLY